MDPLQAARIARSLKGFCDTTRIRILELLTIRECCVTEIVDRLLIDQPKISHHLSVLRATGVVRTRRDGRWLNYSLRPGSHRRETGPAGVAHVFELGDVTVSLRFHAEGGDARRGTPDPAAPPPAPVRDT